MAPVPNLFLIGSQKCGTTSLHNYLARSADIFPAQIKECATLRNFQTVKKYYARSGRRGFSDRKAYHGKILAGYAGQPYILESTTGYTFGTLSRDEGIPGHMAQYSPDARLIYLLRHPVERLVSAYVHQVKIGRFWGSLNDYYANPRSDDVLTSCYGWQLTHYLEHFPRDRVLVLCFEELARNPSALLARVCAFLGIPGEEAAINGSFEVHNQTARKAGLKTVDARFSEDVFSRLLNMLVEDSNALKAQGIDFGWDLSFSTWAEKGGHGSFSAVQGLGHLSLKRNPQLTHFLDYFRLPADPVNRTMAANDFLVYLRRTHQEGRKIQATIEQIASRDPENPVYAYVLGKFLFEAGYPKKARGHQVKACASDPKWFAPYVQLGLIDLKLKRLKKAKVSLEKAVEMRPDYMPGVIHFSTVLETCGELDEAKRVLLEAESRGLETPTLYFKLSHMHYRAGKLSAAVEAVEQAISMNPDDPKFYRHLAGLLKRCGETQAAEAAEARAVSLS
ncbi:MAG: sulfotransferase [Opitutales bacterium]